MAIRIKSRAGESSEQMLRRFKKLCEKEGLTKDIKRKEFYEKPSERRRRDMRKAISRRLREMGLYIPKNPKRGPGGPGGAGGPGGPNRERD
jgi:small subunit ribosomal protein S21